MAIAASDVAAGAASGIGGSILGNAPSNPSVRLAVAIVLFFLAGLFFFVAFGLGSTYVPAWSGQGGGLKALREGIGGIFEKGTADVAQAVPAPEGAS